LAIPLRAGLFAASPLRRGGCGLYAAIPNGFFPDDFLFTIFTGNVHFPTMQTDTCCATIGLPAIAVPWFMNVYWTALRCAQPCFLPWLM